MKCYCRKAHEANTGDAVPLNADVSTSEAPTESSSSASVADATTVAGAVPLNAEGSQTVSTTVSPEPQANTTVGQPVAESSQAPVADATTVAPNSNASSTAAAPPS